MSAQQACQRYPFVTRGSHTGASIVRWRLTSTTACLKYVLGDARHDGSKGRKYTLWKDGFLDAAQGRGDDDYSWAQVFLGTDGPQAGLGAAPARKQNKRRREAYSALMEALDKDSCRDLKTDLRTNANANGKNLRTNANAAATLIASFCRVFDSHFKLLIVLFSLASP